MGALFNNQCYLSDSLAIDAYFSSASPSLNSGSVTYSSFFYKSGSVWMIETVSVNNQGRVTVVSNAPASLPVFPVCDPAEHFNDGFVVGWGIAAILIAVSTLKLINRVRA